MSAVRRLFEELVDKRLWPVALVLVIALVAVPVVIGGLGSGDSGGEHIGAAQDPAPPAPVTPAVQLVGPPSVRSRPGPVRDPFRRAKQKARKVATTTAAPPASPSTASSPSKAASSSKTKPATTKPSTDTATAKPSTTNDRPAPTRAQTAAAIAARSAYETVAHFSGPNADYEHALDRLAVLGAADGPALLYLGVTAGGRYAVFLLGPATSVVGAHRGACVVPEPCRAIGLRPGERVEVQVAGETTHHDALQVAAIRTVRFATRSLARQQRATVADGGRDVLRALVKDVPTAGALGHLLYDPGAGTVALIGAG